jgi:hypothetical protein
LFEDEYGVYIFLFFKNVLLSFIQYKPCSFIFCGLLCTVLSLRKTYVGRRASGEGEEDGV